MLYKMNEGVGDISHSGDNARISYNVVRKAIVEFSNFVKWGGETGSRRPALVEVSVLRATPAATFLI